MPSLARTRRRLAVPAVLALLAALAVPGAAAAAVTFDVSSLRSGPAGSLTTADLDGDRVPDVASSGSSSGS